MVLLAINSDNVCFWYHNDRGNHWRMQEQWARLQILGLWQQLRHNKYLQSLLCLRASIQVQVPLNLRKDVSPNGTPVQECHITTFTGLMNLWNTFFFGQQSLNRSVYSAQCSLCWNGKFISYQPWKPTNHPGRKTRCGLTLGSFRRPLHDLTEHLDGHRLSPINHWCSVKKRKKSSFIALIKSTQL